MAKVVAEFVNSLFGDKVVAYCLITVKYRAFNLYVLFLESLHDDFMENQKVWTRSSFITINPKCKQNLSLRI